MCYKSLHTSRDTNVSVLFSNLWFSITLKWNLTQFRWNHSFSSPSVNPTCPSVCQLINTWLVGWLQKHGKISLVSEKQMRMKLTWPCVKAFRDASSSTMLDTRSSEINANVSMLTCRHHCLRSFPKLHSDRSLSTKLWDTRSFCDDKELLLLLPHQIKSHDTVFHWQSVC